MSAYKSKSLPMPAMIQFVVHFGSRMLWSVWARETTFMKLHQHMKQSQGNIVLCLLKKFNRVDCFLPFKKVLF